MTFIVVLVALLIERFFDWSHLRHWYWFRALQNAVIHRLSATAYLILAVTIVPILLIVALIDYATVGLLYGFIKLIFHVVVLIYCLGPQNLWADTFACVNAMTQGDKDFAADKLKHSFGIADLTYSQSVEKHFLHTIFIEANCRVFAVVFWYLVLGPFGAVMYRLVTLSVPDVPEQELTPELTQQAHLIENILDWIPVRIFVFLFALGGHFVQVISCLRKKIFLGLNANESLLTECGTAAIGIEPAQPLPQDGSAERNAINLIDRCLVITLVLIAIGVLIT